jgi:hypothetical protein
MPAQSGTSQRTGDTWKSQEYVIGYHYYPNQTQESLVVMRAFGEDRIKKFNLEVYDEVRVRYHFEAHEYNGRYFNEIRIDGVTFVGASASKNQQPQQTAQSPNDDPLNGPSDEAPY